MGCCFAKEPKNNHNEKMSLLQKSIEEETSENRISKTLTSVLEAKEKMELHVIQEAGSLEPTIYNDYTELIKHPSAHRVWFAENISSRQFKPHWFNTERGLNKYDPLPETELTDGINDKKLTKKSSHNNQFVNNVGSHHVNSNSESELILFEKQCKSFMPQAEMETIEDNDAVSSRMDKEIAALTNSLCFDIDRHRRNANDEFYSICIIDDDKRNEERQAITNEESITIVQPAIIQEDCRLACPVEEREELLVQEAGLVPVNISLLKDANLMNNNAVQEGEKKKDPPLVLVSEGYRLNTESIATCSVEAQAHVKEGPQNRTWKMDMLNSRITLNESDCEHNSSTPMLVEKGIDMNSLQFRKSAYVCHSSLDDGRSSNTTIDSVFVRQTNIEIVRQGNRQKLENKQKCFRNVNEFQTISDCSDKEISDISEQNTSENLLKYDTVSHQEASCSPENLTKNAIIMLSALNDLVSGAEQTHVPEFSNNEDCNSIRTAQQFQSQINSIPSENSGLKRVLLGNKETTAFSDLFNINIEGKNIEKENCLQDQTQQDFLKSSSKTHEYSSALNEGRHCSISLACSESNELDLDRKQSKAWSKYTFYRPEDQINVVPAENLINGVHETLFNEVESKDSNISFSCILNTSNNSPEMHSVSPEIQEAQEMLANLKAPKNLQTCLSNSQSETMRFPTSDLIAEIEYKETSSSLNEKHSEVYKNSSSLEQSKTAIICPHDHLISRFSVHYENLLKENAENSTFEDNHDELKTKIESSSSKVRPKGNVSCGLETYEDAGMSFIDPGQKDKYAAIPSYEILLFSDNEQESEQDNSNNVLDLMEDILKDSDHVQKLHLRDSEDDDGYPVCESAEINRLFSATDFTCGQECMSYLWIDSFNKTENACLSAGTMQNQGGELRVSPFHMGKYPYHLLMKEKSAIWEWQERDEERVSNCNFIHELP
uniref:Uncharacterized protein n=1 Tax=Naja naja TaxID=35670 RepID=A0A8C6X5W7_NAJNA